jgi:5-methylcytosine-specific restriction enzyme A
VRRYWRSNEAQVYRKLYQTARWKKIRLAQLRNHPLCVNCERKGRLATATVADHVIPHRGDTHVFYQGELQSLCGPCHDHKTSVIEFRGHDDEIGSDGFPVDPNHPWNGT